ncbi:MAG: prolipoprotein diacylglyceryl transferase family protein [Patescibacteria group bacterium]
MYPEIILPFLDIKIFTFGLSLSIAFGLFFFMLYKLSIKTGINSNFFFGSALPLIISTFIFSRLIFILSQWRDYKYIVSDKFLHFFLMSDYNLSFIGGVIGFVIVLGYKLIRFNQPQEKYVDTVVLAFLFAAVIGYIGAFLGGQIYGRPTSLPIGIIYKNESANVPYTSAIIPLAILYSIGSFFLFSALYILRELIKVEGFLGYVGIALFSLMLFIGEFFSGSDDTLSNLITLNFTQVGALLGLIFAVR